MTVPAPEKQPLERAFRGESAAGVAAPRGMVWHMLRRAWIVVLFALVAAGLTWLVVHDNPKTYERTLTYVILPSKNLDVSQIPDALRSLDQQNSQISGTIAEAVGSKAALRRAARTAFDDKLGAGYEIDAGVRPGSDTLTLRLRGRNAQVLAGLAPALSSDSIRWVDANLRSYRLQALDSKASDGPVAPKTFQLMAVAAFLAGALALGAAYLEGASRRRRAEDERLTNAGGPGLVGDSPLDAGSTNVLRHAPSPPVELRQDVEARRQW